MVRRTTVWQRYFLGSALEHITYGICISTVKTFGVVPDGLKNLSANYLNPYATSEYYLGEEKAVIDTEVTNNCLDLKPLPRLSL